MWHRSPQLVSCRRIRRILVIRTDRLGETLLNLPLVAALKRVFSHATISWMVNPALVELLQDAPGVDRALGYSDTASPWWRRVWPLARRLRAERFDLVLISNSVKEFHVATWLAGIPIRVGYDRKWGFLLTHRLEDRRALGDRHEVEYNMGLLAALGVTVAASVVLHLPVTEEGERQTAKLFDQLGVSQAEGIMVIHPWTSQSRKQWPLERVRVLLGRLSGMVTARLVVIGGPEEQRHAEPLLRGMESSVVNVVGRLSLPALAACLRRARVLITNDSGPMHLAAAVGTPVVALFGTGDAGSHPGRWGPWGAHHTVIQKPLQAMTVDEVVEAVQRAVSA